METSCLYPPNRHVLSDSVIGNVMLPARSSQDFVAVDIEKIVPVQSIRPSSRQHSSSQQFPEHGGEVPTTLDYCTPVNTKLNTVFDMKARRRNEKKCRRSSQSSIVSNEDQRTIRHRERCRISQQLYRRRQLKLTQTLEATIQTLQKEIKTLTRQSRDFPPAPTSQSMWVVAVQYFHHYQNFILAPTAFRDTARNFLHATMAPDVVDGTLCGVEALLESSTLLSHYFDGIHLTLAGLNFYDASTVVASVIISVTISENSLIFAFPNLNCKENDSVEFKERSRIAAKLLGQRIVMHSTVSFYWNNSNNRVVRLLSQADMLSPLLSMLGNLTDVSRVFEKANVTPGWNLVAK